MKHRSNILFYLNGIAQEVLVDEAGMMLADYLRVKKRLTGTKIVCAEGDCGACSVLRLAPVLHAKGIKRNLRFVPINSCITPVAQMDGSSLVTVEALAENSDSAKLNLSLVQKALVDENGSQCGFCTPGFVVAITGLVEKKLCEGNKTGSCSIQEAKNCMTGNLCRCTGYQPILEAAMKVELSKCVSLSKRFSDKAQAKALAKSLSTPVLFKNDRFRFYAPTKLKDAATYLAKNKSARLIGAGTDLGVVHNKGKIELVDLVSLHLIPELYEIKKTAKTIRVGARVNLSELRKFSQKSVPEFSKFLDLFASPQIKNLATLVGNIGNASPIADTPPFLLSANAVLHLQGPRGKRKIYLDEYYLGYRKTALRPSELIVSVEFEIPKQNETLRLYKVSQRKDLDISCVNAAFRIRLSKNSKNSGQKIEDIRIALGGVAATPLRLKKTENLLRGKVLQAGDASLLKDALASLQSEISPLDDVRGSGEFRRVLVSNLFSKYFREINSLALGKSK